MLYFFLSHAHGDDDSYVAKFFRDLCAEVERLVGEVDQEVGFLATAGADSWARHPRAVDAALANCRVFIALCSPRYFLSERCGREWSLFADRLRRYERNTHEDPDVLIPIVWARADPPASAAEIRGRLDAGPASPSREGVSQLIRLRSWRRSYVDFVGALARRVVAAANRYDIPPPAPGVDLRSVASAFDYRERFARGTVHFVVAAGTQGEMGTVRQDVSYYGEQREDWAPFRPDLPEPLVVHAGAVAAERLFGSDVAALDDLADRVDRAYERNEIVVLLVDAWATKLAAYQQALAEIDDRADPAVAVLVSSSESDAETVAHRGQLAAGVRDTFPHNVDRHDPMFRAGIATHQGFDADLVAVLEKAQNRIFRFGRVFRQPSPDVPAGRPLLKGP